MPSYELIREILNSCPNNQMRDVFFSEVETDDPEAYVRTFLGGKAEEVRTELSADGSVTVFAVCNGLNQKFLFTPDDI